MPRGDGTGPMGYGPMSGRGRGSCAGYVHPAAPRGGFCGGGRGFGRRGYMARPLEASEVDELQVLKSEADSLEKALGDVKKRIGELEKE